MNLASRIEAIAETVRIHVWTVTCQRIRYFFEFVDRGIVEVHGKGPMRARHLKGERSSSPPLYSA